MAACAPTAEDGTPDLSAYRGIGQFGAEYRRMLERDSHAPGSVDRVLLDRMVRLCSETASHLYGAYTPAGGRYVPGSRPDLERHLAHATGGAQTDEEHIAGVVRFCASRGERGPPGIGALVLGGTEEEVIARGSDWCTDVARAACALCQVAGYPARLAYLFDTGAAYSGHAMVEVQRAGHWGAVDPTFGAVYLRLDGAPASVWELMRHPTLHASPPRRELAERAPPWPITADQFRAGAIANYFVWERDRYDYTVGAPNAYCRAILEMASRGWPGGLRWIQGEDQEASGAPSNGVAERATRCHR